MIQFKYGTLEKYNSLEQKDPDVLYFLDNHTLYKGDDLISCVKTISDDYPETPTDDMKQTYLISLKTGEIRYVTDDLQYINLSEIQFNNWSLSQDFAEKVKQALITEEVTMPGLSVNQNTLIWTPSNKETINIIKF